MLDESVSVLEIMEIGCKAAEGSADTYLDGTLPLGRQFRDFFCRLNKQTGRNPPIAKRLARVMEDELNRYCFVLAQLEEAVRTGRVDSVPARGDSIHAESLLGLVESHWIDDFTELSLRFYDGFNYLLRLPHVLNPKFDGSMTVDGADADLIVNGPLIEIKSTTPCAIRGDWFWQLLGYVLLDYSDQYRINGVGIYMARQGRLFTWDIEDAIRGLCSGEPPAIEELRTQFKELTYRLA